MSKRRKVASVAFTGAAAVAATGAAAGPAFAAASTWHVNPAGAYFALNSGATTLGVVNNQGQSVLLTCSQASASGSLVSTASGSSVQLGTIAKADFGTGPGACSLVGTGIHFTATLTKGATIWGHNYDPSTGRTTGNIFGTPKSSASGITAQITGQAGFTCNATVVGHSVPGSFQNPNQLLINKSRQKTLTIKSVTGCAGVIQSGNQAFFSATFVTSHSDLTVSHEQ